MSHLWGISVLLVQLKLFVSFFNSLFFQQLSVFFPSLALLVGWLAALARAFPLPFPSLVVLLLLFLVYVSWVHNLIWEEGKGEGKKAGYRRTKRTSEVERGKTYYVLSHEAKAGSPGGVAR